MTGTIAARGNEVDVQVGLEAPVFAGGPGLETALAGMALQEGYETTVRSFSAQQQQVQTHRLAVTGTETVTVPAGEMSVYVVEATPVGDAGQEATYWVLQEAPHHVVRSETKLPPAMGGGTATKELTSMQRSGG